MFRRARRRRSAHVSAAITKAPGSSNPLKADEPNATCEPFAYSARPRPKVRIAQMLMSVSWPVNKQNAHRHKHDATDALDQTEMLPRTPRLQCSGAVGRETGQHERDAQAKAVEQQEQGALGDRLLLRRQRQQAAQEQADAGRPADAERRTYKEGTCQAAARGKALRIDVQIGARQPPQAQNPKHLQTEQHDQQLRLVG